MSGTFALSFAAMTPLIMTPSMARRMSIFVLVHASHHLVMQCGWPFCYLGADLFLRLVLTNLFSQKKLIENQPGKLMVKAYASIWLAKTNRIILYAIYRDLSTPFCRFLKKIKMINHYSKVKDNLIFKIVQSADPQMQGA